MANGKHNSNNGQQSGTCSHQQEIARRPHIGVQHEFDAKNHRNPTATMHR
ncbi:hypothetical protein [Aliidiomarina indica]|nr:hypothetical protein [Aliidiomarina indica]